MIGTALVVFPKLALGLSGFETGVVVMPLVKGDRRIVTRTFRRFTQPVASSARQLKLSGRIHNTRKLLTDSGLDHELPAVCEQHCDYDADSCRRISS